MSEVELSQKKGSRIFKILGIITIIGLLVAVARIVIRVFREESRTREEPDSGV